MKLFNLIFLFTLTYHAAFSQDIIALKDLYATSTNIPNNENSVYNLFDRDNSTIWSSMIGAGPDEGIMMYFKEPIDIAYLKISQPQNSTNSTIVNLRIYINGANYKTMPIDTDPIIEIQKEGVSSLYLKAFYVEGSKRKFFQGLDHLLFEGTNIALSDIEFLNNLMQSVEVKVPHKETAKVTPSSTLSSTLSYGAQNMFDGKKEYGWVEGVDGNGIGESIQFEFESSQTITGIKIRNGYQRSDKHFVANARLKSLQVSNEDGDSYEITVADEQGEQELLFPEAITGTKIKMTIQDAYEGAKYKDLVISQLKFVDDNGDILIDPQLIEPIKMELLEEVKGTILEGIVDQRVFNAIEDMEGFNRSIILRSDYSFVVYDDVWTEDKSNEIIAEGNWQIKELSESKARIRVFGKLTRTSEITDYYRGDSSESYQNIFQDYLNIENGVIAGEKFIKNIKLFPNE